ncbi:MAG: 2-amino-4-hydroxy-6-hydroxymethyldihydropteridine diphosphokinase [Phycisphaerales bacterium]|nr:2-amino-4-hydroxy-6-hydroxymethyldihydropteridine diphosphokinase [Phycisphaerales bacterium]
MNGRAFIALGSNLGDRTATIDHAVARLAAHDEIELAAVSSLYETAPIGPPQPHYLNAVAEIHTTLSPHALLRALLSIEQLLGRVRDPAQRNAPRTIDLDILLFGECVIADCDLEIPHPRLSTRPFVLRPLLELDAALTHPATGELLLSLLCADGKNDGVVMWRTRITHLPSRQ